MTEEKHTPNAISFIIEMPAKMTEKEPEIKKRLEAESAAFAPQVSLESIQAKLNKAELKRRASLHQMKDSAEKLNKVHERKASLEQAAMEHNTKLESTLTHAEQKREQALALKLQKVQMHLNKVEKIRK